jgi:hypothetical protein
MAKMSEAELARRAKIQAHNAAIMAQIGEKQALQGKYSQVESNANAIIGAIASYIEQLRSASELLESIIVTGPNGNGPVGEGKLVTEDCHTLERVSGVFAEVVSACQNEKSKLDKEIANLRSQLMSI